MTIEELQLRLAESENRNKQLEAEKSQLKREIKEINHKHNSEKAQLTSEKIILEEKVDYLVTA